MKFLLDEDERWPTFILQKPDEKMLGSRYWNEKIIDIDEKLVVDLENAHRNLESAENAIRVAIGREPKSDNDSWYFPLRP